VSRRDLVYQRRLESPIEAVMNLVKVYCSLHFPSTPSTSRLLQQGVTESTPDNGASSTNSLARTLALQARVNLDQIHSDQRSCGSNTLGDEVSLTQSQTTTNRCTRARRPHRVERINIERQMNRRVASDPAQRHIHDLANSVPDSVSTCSSMPSIVSTHRSISCMLKALIPLSLRIFFSPLSISLSPM